MQKSFIKREDRKKMSKNKEIYGSISYQYPNKEQSIIELMESKYPVIAKDFKKIQQEQYELFAKKMISYGMGNIAMGSNLETKDEVKFSLTAIWIRMNDKMNRLKNLIIKNVKNPLSNEATIDSWIDLTNYAIIAQIVSRGNWRKK